ncbi:MAG: bifunctional histidinal dehydrogenase and histidinol dehydrogenase [Actinomycetota bacterium]
MCGIVGYTGKNSALNPVVEGLRRLEYRGYDSAGIALPTEIGKPLYIEKRAGKLKNLEEAAEISNFISPEHLELSVDDPDMLVNSIKHAGAIFMGRNTCEAVGDYCAGPNHVLPTSRTARFSSPLGVYDFQKRSSLIKLSNQGARKLGKIASVLAHGEGLQAHAKSAEYRIDNE